MIIDQKTPVTQASFIKESPSAGSIFITRHEGLALNSDHSNTFIASNRFLSILNTVQPYLSAWALSKKHFENWDCSFGCVNVTVYLSTKMGNNGTQLQKCLGKFTAAGIKDLLPYFLRKRKNKIQFWLKLEKKIKDMYDC